jgi:hypothetical protein
MAKSKIVLSFNSVPDIGANITIGDSLNGATLQEVSVPLRYAPKVFSTPIYAEINPGGEPDPRDRWLGNAAGFFMQAFNLDYNSTNRYNVNADQIINTGLGTVTIQATESNVVFTAVSTPSSVSTTITNETEDVPFNIISVDTVAADSNPCDQVKVVIRTTEPASTVNGEANTANPVEVLSPRGLNNLIILIGPDGRVTSWTNNTLKLLLSNVILTLNAFPGGTTATIQVTGLGQLDIGLEYSLDGDNWRTDNSFGSLASGEYTLSVRDKYNCVVQKEFLVSSYEDVTAPSAYAPLPSKANSIRYKKDVEWLACSNYKTDENTLSKEVDVKLPYTEIQRFQACDSETTQIRSSFQTIEASTTDSNGQVVSLSVTKQTQFMGLKDKRDAVSYSLGNNKTAIRFGVGSLYDYDTGDETGTYVLNGALPIWAVLGNYVNHDGGWFQITNILFDEAILSEIIVIDKNTGAQEQTILVCSIYNIFNYEVYEFTVNFVNYNNKQLTVKILESDPNFDEVSFTSELIDVRETHFGTLEICYYSEDNTDIFFGTGIKFKLRIPYIAKRGLSEDETTIHKTDSNVVMLDTINYEGDEIEFEPISKEMWRKVMIALSHPFLKINGQDYIKMPGSFSSEGPLDDTNLYSLVAKLLKTTSASGNSGEGRNYIDGTEIEIPGIVTPGSNGGFIQY